MKTAVVDAALAILVLATWLAAAGFLRLRSPLDRLHCVAFVNVAAGLPLLLAAFAGDGPSIRAFKILLLMATSLLAGAAGSHAIGRAVVLRQSAPETRGGDAT